MACTVKGCFRKKKNAKAKAKSLRAHGGKGVRVVKAKKGYKVVKC